MDNKLNRIHAVHRRWMGGFMRRGSALCEIGDILDEKTITVNDLVCMDASSKEILFKAETAEINY